MILIWATFKQQLLLIYIVYLWINKGGVEVERREKGDRRANQYPVEIERRSSMRRSDVNRREEDHEVTSDNRKSYFL